MTHAGDLAVNHRQLLLVLKYPRNHSTRRLPLSGSVVVLGRKASNKRTERYNRTLLKQAMQLSAIVLVRFRGAEVEFSQKSRWRVLWADDPIISGGQRRVEVGPFPLFMNSAFMLWRGRMPRTSAIRSPSLPTTTPATATSSNPVAQAVYIPLPLRSLLIDPFQSYPVVSLSRNCIQLL